MNSNLIYEYIQALENKTKALLEQQNVLVSLLCANDKENKRVYVDVDEDGWYYLAVTSLDNKEVAMFGNGV